MVGHTAGSAGVHVIGEVLASILMKNKTHLIIIIISGKG